jgi:hypothetical protein
MSGFGIQYPPPTEDVPIFDPLLFLEAVVIAEGGGGGGSYLNFPFAQGKEQMAEMDVTGVANFFSGINMTGALGENFTNNQNIIMNGTVGKYIQFPDGTHQTTASSGESPSGVIAGDYTLTNLTVNTYGIITSASNGTIPPQIVPNNQLIGQSIVTFPVGNDTVPISPPVGTRKLVMIVCGAGSTQTADSLNGSTMTPGVTGGGGACVTITMDMTAFQNTQLNTPILYYYYSFGAVAIGYYNSIYNLYGSTLPVVGNPVILGAYYYAL